MDGIMQFVELRMMERHNFCFDREAMDEIAAGKNLEQHRLAVVDGTYLGDLGTLFHRCLAVLEETHLNPTEHDFAMALADEVSSRWAKAVLERPKIETLAKKLIDDALDALYAKTTDADLDLVARYRRLTRFVCEVARRNCPRTDLGWLWAQM